MAAIETVYGEELVRQSHTGNTNFIDVLTVLAASWTAGATYILLVNSQIEGNVATAQYSFRTIHGAVPTVFPGSLFVLEPFSAGGIYNYFYMTKYTVPGVAEDVTFQFKTNVAGNRVRANTNVLLAIRLDDLTEGTDWVYGEDDDTSAPVQHTTAFVSFASTGAFTPDNLNDDWLVIGCADYLIDNVAINAQYRIERDGETEVAPLFSEEGKDVTEEKVYGLSRAFTLLNAPHTFTMQGRDDAVGANKHQYTAIFTLRLDAFEDHGFFWNEAEVAFAMADTWEEVGDLDITPTREGNFIAIATTSHDQNQAGQNGRLRIQVDGTTIPAGRDGLFGQDTRAYDATDENPLLTVFRSNLAASPRDIDLDGLTGGLGGGPKQEDRSLVVFSVELAAAPPPPPIAGRTVGVTSRAGRTVLLAAQRDDPDGNPTDEYLLLRLDEFGQLQTTSEGVAEVVAGRTKGMTLRATGNVVLLAAQRDDPDGNPTGEYVLLRVDQFGRLRTTSEAAGTSVSGRTKGMTQRVVGNVVLAVGQRDDPGGTPTSESLALRTDEFGRLRILPEV